MRSIFRAVLICGASMWVSASALAIPFNAAYELETGDVLNIMFDGTVQPDGDTVIVDGLLMLPTFNGVEPVLGPVSGFLSFTDANGGASPGAPVVTPAHFTFSGSTMDFIFFNDFPDDGFFIAVDIGGGTYAAGPSFGTAGAEYDEGFAPDRWSLTVKALEPGTFGLLGLALVGLALRRRWV